MKKCSVCNNELADSAVICDSFGSTLEAVAATPAKRENMAGGVTGAIIGALLGGASIILVSRLGFVAAICGLILAVCVFKGYELLGGRLSKVGALICLALVLVTPYIADRLDWALLVLEAYGEGITLGEAYALIPTLIEEEVIESAVYWTSVGKLYLFTVLGAASSVISAFKK